MALELARDCASQRLGSVISICGPPSTGSKGTTPAALFTRLSPASSAAKAQENALKAAFGECEVIRGSGSGDNMPRGREEWTGVMRFWGKYLGKDEEWKGEGEVYEVTR